MKNYTYIFLCLVLKMPQLQVVNTDYIYQSNSVTVGWLVDQDQAVGKVSKQLTSVTFCLIIFSSRVSRTPPHQSVWNVRIK